MRGTPQQIIEKYLALARDAQLSNDRVAEQAFLQHAEHYTRMLGEAQRELARERKSATAATSKTATRPAVRTAISAIAPTASRASPSPNPSASRRRRSPAMKARRC